MGVGDPFGCDITHAITCGMGGIRTAGDLVLRVQLAKKMKIDAAKAYVADKLGVSEMDLYDCITMTEVRKNLGLGTQETDAGAPIGMDAKFNIARILDIPINSVERFKKNAKLK
jgi:dimethylamine--corrinoid protein Co-methyltransferase